MVISQNIISFIGGGLSPDSTKQYGIYEKSLHQKDGLSVFVADVGERDVIVAEKALSFSGEPFSAGGKQWTLAEQNHENAKVLRALFPFTAPVSVLKKPRTVGVGDRLGIATSGHIRVFEKYDAYPILAQQSIRELTLTNRTFEDVLDCVSFAVFKENFTKGFGADGDHLKTPAEVEYAISCGYTMITLDCSEHIRNGVETMTDEEVLSEYIGNPALEEKYVGKSFDVDGETVAFDKMSFARMCLVYNEAIDFAADIYAQFFAGKEDALDFEISIDETATPTEPAQHFYVANELISRGVRPATVAPRFCGEFQKGIDYIGDLSQFEKDFKVHAAIARHFGYKISVHSGSDKFSVFPAVGKYTDGNFHLKTAGTNWLEAMKIVAKRAPSLYREVHGYALGYAFAEARKYYHVTTNLAAIPSLDTLSDEELPNLFDNNDARQLIHITYGLILNEKDETGKFVYKDRLYSVWREHAGDYADALENHIGKHLEKVYDGFRK